MLEGYGRSPRGDFEVIVADDGSGPETAELVRGLAAQFRHPLRHVWQPHDGFRLAAARNAALRVAVGEVIVFTDGDCIPLPGSLDSPSRACKQGHALTGGRCYLSEEETRSLLSREATVDDVLPGALAREGSGLRRERRKNRFHAFTKLKPRPKLLTANAAVHRLDLERVNGFDERFVGWGYEDEDLARRLRRVGVRIGDGSLESIVLHLFHPVHETHRPNARGSANYAYFKQARYLTRPLRGLVARTPRDLGVELLGKVPGPLAHLSRSSAPEPPEVSLCFGRKILGRRPRGEVVLRGLVSERFSGPEELYRFLAVEL